jgi:aspartate/methionine/tyrosine aminotransferase
MHDNLINCAPVISQYAALAALKNEDVILQEYRDEYKKRRSIMGKYLEEMREYIQFVWPEGTYYFFPKIKGVDNTEFFCFDMLEKVKLAAVPGSDFGIGGNGRIRLCFGKSEDEIREGMKRLKIYLKKYTHTHMNIKKRKKLPVGNTVVFKKNYPPGQYYTIG